MANQGRATPIVPLSTVPLHSSNGIIEGCQIQQLLGIPQYVDLGHNFIITLNEMTWAVILLIDVCRRNHKAFVPMIGIAKDLIGGKRSDTTLCIYWPFALDEERFIDEA
jgi:hypothetical protein